MGIRKRYSHCCDGDDDDDGVFSGGFVRSFISVMDSAEGKQLTRE